MLDELHDVPPDAAVIVAVEVFRADQVGDAVERLVVDQQRPEERLLRLYRVRRYAERDELRVTRRLARELLGYGHSLYLPSRPQS